MARTKDHTSVRYLLPHTKASVEQHVLDVAEKQFAYALAQEMERPMLDDLIANTRSPEDMYKIAPTLIHDSGWKDVK
jgi:hypothetical protein